MNNLTLLFARLSRVSPVVLLTVLIGLAALVTFIVMGKTQESEEQLRMKQLDLEARSSAKGKVVYAIKDIGENEVIKSESLEERLIPQSKIPVDALTSASLASGRISKYGISAGQIVSQHDLALQGAAVDYEQRLRPGMRAVSFTVDGGNIFIAPDSHIDIYAMVGSGPETKVSPILSNIEVLAVGQIYNKAEYEAIKESRPTSPITVAVTPQEAARLMQGISAGKLYLALRNEKDRQPLATVEVKSLFSK